MIAYIKGKLAYLDPSLAIIDVQGVGYQIRISLQTFSLLKNANELTQLFTHFHVKEDSHTLYGFFEPKERALFIDLISVSGIGPGTAMVMLSSLSATEIAHAIVTENLKVIQGIKGIGTKTAQRAIIELKDKLKKEHFEGDQQNLLSTISTANSLKTEALAALTTLGINRATAEKSIDLILSKEGYGISLENLIKQALR
jgi:holliday junction DNA helicase RuvA